MTRFQSRLNHTPEHWKTPLIDVIDTAETVCLVLQDWDIDPADAHDLIVGLTQLVLEREEVLHERTAQEELLEP